jgi:hypothetical protein
MSKDVKNMVIPSFRFSLGFSSICHANIESSHNELTWFYNTILEQTHTLYGEKIYPPGILL